MEVVKPANMPTKAVLSDEDTKNVAGKEIYESIEEYNKRKEQSTTIKVANKIIVDLLSIIPVMAVAKE